MFFLITRKYQRDTGFSGLEAAIILIAFVVVAAVFSYSILSSGFFATSKAQDTTHTGFRQASSGTYIDGTLYGEVTTPSGKLQKLTFYIAIPETGLDQDLSTMIMAYTKSDASLPQSLKLGDTPTSSTFSAGNGGPYTSTILKAGSKTRINFDELYGPTATGWFSIEVKPQNGAPFLLHRYTPEGYAGGIIR